MDLYEALSMRRAMRRVKPDPIPDEIVASIMDAGTQHHLRSVSPA